MDTDRTVIGRAGGGGTLVALVALAALAVATGTSRPALAQDEDEDAAADRADGRAGEGAGEGDRGDRGENSDGNRASGGKVGLRTTQVCIDREIANRLAIKRKRRGAVDRLFVKQARHELTLLGGYYSSDLYSATYAAGGSYTYHMTEDMAVEFGAMYTHANADIIRALEDSRGALLDDDYSRVLLVESLLVWTPIYGKLRLGGQIMRFDINMSLGVGVVESQTSRGATGVAGFGFKLFIGKAMALRVDARNHVFRQELLDERFLVNDVSVISGLSLFLPFGN